MGVVTDATGLKLSTREGSDTLLSTLCLVTLQVLKLHVLQVSKHYENRPQVLGYNFQFPIWSHQCSETQRYSIYYNVKTFLTA